MKRRTVLAAAGLGLAGAAGAWYLLGRRESAAVEHPGTMGADFDANGDYPPDEDPGDGYPPEFGDPPDAPDVDPSSFDTTNANGETVPLAPIDVVVRWYRRGEARSVDARGRSQYEHAHVFGAVKSSAQRDSSGGGIDGWPEDDRIVTYCGCPHHLSSQRAAGLLKAGYSEVYALDEGFGAWSDRGYPMLGTTFGSSDSTDGTRTDDQRTDGQRTDDQRTADQRTDATEASQSTNPALVDAYVLEGVVDPRYAGEFAWARSAGSQEAAPILDDGTFAMHVRFPDATAETPVEVSTPAYTVTRPLADLAAGTIDGT